MNELIFKFQEMNVRTLLLNREPWFVGKDVAEALRHTNPERAIRNFVDDEDKGVTVLVTPGGTQQVTIINEPGVYSLILQSKTETAKEFKHWVTHDVLPSIHKQGFYSLLSDEELVAFITERQKLNPATLDLIDKPKIKKAILQNTRDERTEETRQVWIARFGKRESINVPKELRRIWRDDMPMYHKYLDKFHVDENKERRGHIVTIE